METGQPNVFCETSILPAPGHSVYCTCMPVNERCRRNVGCKPSLRMLCSARLGGFGPGLAKVGSGGWVGFKLQGCTADFGRICICTIDTHISPYPSCHHSLGCKRRINRAHPTQNLLCIPFKHRAGAVQIKAQRAHFTRHERQSTRFHFIIFYYFLLFWLGFFTLFDANQIGGGR